MKDFLIATSISPSNVDKQIGCLKTWQNLGSKCVTLNFTSEVKDIQNAQSDFEVVEVDRSAKELVGKPLVFIDDFLQYFIKSPHSHMILLNSDLTLRYPQELNSALEAMDFDLFFGQRVDVSNISETKGELFKGFDYFVFSKDLAKNIPNSNFCIGAPWWDHWIPLAAIFLNAKVYSCEEPIVFHVIHDVNYGVDSLGLMGEQLDKKILEILQEVSKKVDTNSPGAVSTLRFCHFLSAYYQSSRKVIADLYPKFEELDPALKDMIKVEMAHLMPVMTFDFIKFSSTTVTFQS